MSAVNTNRFLAPSLQGSTVKDRGNAKFSDNRLKTITPMPYIETITPGKNQLAGFIGEIDAYGNITPEPNAYIYIYINGFLINPPVVAKDGVFNKENKTAVISDSTGRWATTSFFFDVLPAFQYGQTITFRAKAPLKQMSYRSIPYFIGGMPSPIELGVFGDGGILRPPYDGESSLMGRVSYWIGHTDPYKGIPLFDCSNHLYIYIDGLHANSSDKVLGEIFPNEIRGTNATFPVFQNLVHHNLSLVVNNVQLDISLKDLYPVDTVPLLINFDKNDGTAIFQQPYPNLGLKLFKNGQRLQEGYDFTYYVDPSSNLGKINFNFANVIPTPTDKFIILFQYQAGNFNIGEILNGPIDGVNNTFTILQQAKLDTIELYRNGLHLTSELDYTISGNIITFSDGQIPEEGDILIADYQPIIAKTQYVFSEIPIGIIDGINDEFVFTTPDIIGNPHIFKNGLLLQEGDFFDYIIKNENIIKFTPWAKPEVDDNILVTFNATPILLNQVVDYLNKTEEFKNNCLTSNTLNIKPIVNSVVIEGLKNSLNKYFILPITDLPVNFRLFKNGARLKESFDSKTGDYFLDYGKGLIVLFVPPEKTDVLVGLFNYITSDFVIGETPSGPIDGNNVTFNLSMVPKSNTVQVYYNGMRLSPFGVPDYSIIQNVLTFETFTPEEGDIILVDYEVAFGFETFTTSFIPEGQVTGDNAQFSFPTPEAGVAINVFKNGLLQQLGWDYLLNRTNITFLQRSMPEYGDIIIVEFNDSSLFTNNPNDQLRISSPYTLDIKRYNDPENPIGFSGKILFGSDVELYPGKDDDNTFRFWFNSQTGYWKWTWYNPITGITTPFTTGQRITARVKNDRPFIYSTKR